MRLTSSIIRALTCALALCLCVPVPAFADVIDPEIIDDVVISEDKREDDTQSATSQNTQNDNQTKSDASEFPRELTQEEYDQLSEFIRENYTGIHYDEQGNLVDENDVVVLDEDAFIIDERGGMGTWPPEDDVESPSNTASSTLLHYAPAVVAAVAAVAVALIFRLRRKR